MEIKEGTRILDMRYLEEFNYEEKRDKYVLDNFPEEFFIIGEVE